MLSRLGLFLLLSNCGNFEAVRAKDASLGFSAGVVSAETLAKLKQSLKPVFKLKNYPLQLCERILKEDQPVIRCGLLNCEKDCIYEESEEEFWKREGRVIGFNSGVKLLSSVKTFCEASANICENYSSKLKGKTIIYIPRVENEESD